MGSGARKFEDLHNLLNLLGVTEKIVLMNMLLTLTLQDVCSYLSVGEIFPAFRLEIELSRIEIELWFCISSLHKCRVGVYSLVVLQKHLDLNKI